MEHLTSRPRILTSQHPVTPPPDKIHNWLQLKKVGCSIEQIIAHAANWGADQELQHCAGWVSQFTNLMSTNLINARRPKPPSLKEQALMQLDLITQQAYAHNFPGFQADFIRRALEALDD